MSKIAVFPGSFDPITLGHVDVVQRSLPLFDKIIVAIGQNSQKSGLFPIEERKAWIEQLFPNEPKLEVTTYEGLTVNFCKAVKANYIVRGIRSAADFEYEKTIAHLNHAMAEDIETFLIISRPEYSSISSTIVREILRGKGDVSPFVPGLVVEGIKDFL